ncbi:MULTISPECIES: ferritin-like domain-containing protein [Herbaspirillum]|jgi:bacterioferritin|uniref:Bacterioferritin n=1 Tax=Herbaspirillum rubrisubalbicans Os34 TaxID=1235827 RepID=A0A6M3ZME9_9BURK|nr:MULTISPECIES: ferritin-like domain-containing protein [Herbaspirillum]NQE51815.1 bacterioferritin [Herbaspirillum rubrisubalbicans]QJP99746.1 bacterioferritin [Herbaspirillum rubrisubalbicans Os34]
MTMTKNPPQTELDKKPGFHLDKEAIRAAASKIDDGAVTEGYRGNREEVVAMLNDALATELLCVMRYKRHYYTAKGLEIEAIKGEFLQHAQEEQSHADQIAERIVQLNGEPDFNPQTIAERSHAQYDESTDIKDMIRANLVEERVAIEAYRQMIERIGDDDPTTKHLLIQIMAQEEEHADDMSDLLGL